MTHRRPDERLDVNADASTSKKRLTNPQRFGTGSSLPAAPQAEKA